MMFDKTEINFRRQWKFGRFFCCGLFLFALAFVTIQTAQADTALKFEKSTAYGDVLDQAANAVELSAGRIYIAGSESAANMRALAVGYEAPPAGDPLFSFRWQSDAALPSTENFTDVAATADSLYFTGQSSSSKTRQSWPFLVKFSNQGKSQSGAQVWLARPQLFEKNQEGAFYAVLLVQEEAGPAIYVTGYASSQPTNRTAILAKYDLSGNLLWFKRLSDQGERGRGAGLSLAAQDGSIYVGGYTDKGEKKDDVDNIPLYTTLWKYDASGTEIWRKQEPDSRLFFMKNEAKDVKVDLAAAEGFLYIAAARKKGEGAEVLLLKYDSDGEPLWSAEWDGKSFAGYARAGFPAGISADKDRLFVAGWTASAAKKGASSNEDAFLLEVDKEYGFVLAVHERGEPAQNERALGVQTDGADAYLVGSARAPASKGKTPQSDLTLFQYKVQPITNVTIEIQPETKKPAKQEKGEKKEAEEKGPSKIAVTIFSSDNFNPSKDINTKSLTFGRTGHEPSWESCAIKDANSDGVLDLVCYFEPQFKSKSEKLDTFSKDDGKGILRGDTVSGSPLMGKAKLGLGQPDPEPVVEVPAPPAPTPVPEAPVTPPLTSTEVPVAPPPVVPASAPLVSTETTISPSVTETTATVTSPEEPSTTAAPQQEPATATILQAPVSAPLIATEQPVAPPPVEAPSVTTVTTQVETAPVDTLEVLISAPVTSSTGTTTQLPTDEAAPTTTLQAPLTTSSSPVVAATVTAPATTATTSTTSTTTDTAPKNITTLQTPTLISAPYRTTAVAQPAPAAPLPPAAPAVAPDPVAAAAPVSGTSAVLGVAPATGANVLGANTSAPVGGTGVLRSLESSRHQKIGSAQTQASSGSVFSSGPDPVLGSSPSPSSDPGSSASAPPSSGLAQAYNDLGQEALESGDAEGAIEYLQEALNLDPKSVEANANIGKALVKAGKFREAKKHLLEAAKLKPGDEGLIKQLQEVSDKLGEPLDLTGLDGSSDVEEIEPR